VTAYATYIDTQDADLLVGILSLHTPWSSTTKGAVQGKVNVLLAVNSHNKRWYIHYLLANPAAAIHMLKKCTQVSCLPQHAPAMMLMSKLEGWPESSCCCHAVYVMKCIAMDKGADKYIDLMCRWRISTLAW